MTVIVNLDRVLFERIGVNTRLGHHQLEVIGANVSAMPKPFDCTLKVLKRCLRQDEFLLIIGNKLLNLIEFVVNFLARPSLGATVEQGDIGVLDLLFVFT